MRLGFAWTTDEQQFEFAIHSAMSLAASQPAPSNIHLFCYRFQPELSTQVRNAFAAQGANICVEGIADQALEQHQTGDRITTPALLKLQAVEKLIGQYDRVAYFDNDLLLFGHLKLEAINFGLAPIAAVLDIDPTDTGAFRAGKYGTRWNGAMLTHYFNSGFMVFEAANWEGRKFHEVYAAALAEHAKGCTYKVRCTSIDQCALNRTFESNWLPLPLTYNFQASAKFTRGWRTALVRHYAGPRKFMPISLLRNDGRDIRVLNRVRRAIGRPTVPFPMLYEAFYRLNAARKYQDVRAVRRFLEAAQTGTAGEEAGVWATPAGLACGEAD